ncbi:NADPH-dependent 2,4-dienoyl-CoA reductase/sulfur reductase-like enzyme [Bacillus ectoiniformans]|uniref:CoA-disulfide reductase n=1 Tax=Bacillus ectoiniformans TaxID=1494429 RepID=UPI00195E4562|nr:CoA-disulfide reductase [Bacillus ectoiniformans]MBM7649833.1 NADPH-dependent 2,4-dienoyl-CoA reductase/sulfur reductase-like enzyme [Bacillus ectoiniformans]
MKYVIIGGDAAGMSAAMQITRKDPYADIVTLEKGGIYSYGQCGLPYVIGGLIESTDKLIARSAETFRERYAIDARVHHEVTKVDPVKKTVSGVQTLTGESFSIDYDKLLIATGASPYMPSWKGINKHNSYCLKTIPDAKRLQEVIEQGIRHVTIVGGGYIGLEMAENLKRRNIKVRMIQRSDYVANMFDKDMAMHIHEEAKKHDIELILNENVTEVKGKDRATAIVTDKNEYPTDLVLVSVGVRPNTGFLIDTGIELKQNGAILVNEYLETSLEDIYAAGDCATHYHIVKKQQDYIPLGTTANKQGRLAGMNMIGKKRTFKGITGTSILQFMDVSAAITGLSEKAAKELEIPYQCVQIQSKDHAGYYPGASPLHIKLIYQKEDFLLLGAQIIGEKGVDKRIDVLSTALFHEMSIEDLEDLDLSYAPPFNGVWDPLQQAARRVSN